MSRPKLENKKRTISLRIREDIDNYFNENNTKKSELINHLLLNYIRQKDPVKYHEIK